MAGYAASNNGLSFRTVNSESDITTGEVYFNVDSPSDVTATELAAAFSGYVAAVKNQKLDVLNAEYHPQFLALKEAYAAAALGNTDSTVITTRQTEIQTEYTTLKTALLAAQQSIIES